MTVFGTAPRCVRAMEAEARAVGAGKAVQRDPHKGDGAGSSLAPPRGCRTQVRREAVCVD